VPPEVLGHWASVLVFAAVAFVIPFSLLVFTFVLSTRARRRAGDKSIPFESGVSASTFAPHRFTISYYLTAMLFIVFDIEIVFLYPLALRMHALGTFGLVEMLVFVALLVVAYVYVWRKGALEWR
jgi:NADH-quinone oxidoreductase subunit A